jgi:hypothetical protein
MKHVTKILIIGIFLPFVCTMQLSAQKCKFDYDKTDPITDEITKGITFRAESRYSKETYDMHYKIGFHRIGSTFYLDFEIWFQGNKREVISKGEVLTLKLSDGEVITLSTQSEVLPSQHASYDGIYTLYKVKYDIDTVSLQKIADNPPTFYRLSIDNNNYDKTPSEEIRTKIAQTAACILQ